jgi:regulation of enolase protein 1 (concanavalin A-like superfamily)
MASQLPFNIINSSATLPSPTSSSFQLKTQVPTDIWRKPGPPKVDRFTAPILYKTIPVSSFQRARVTVSANWDAQYDQGGLLFVFPQTDGTKKWIKSGIEFFQEQVFVSTVAAENGADWSLVQTGLKGEKGNTVTLEARNEKGTLWIYVVDGEKLVPIREVTWALSDGENRDMWVGVFAASEDSKKKKEFVVDFEGFELDIV